MSEQLTDEQLEEEERRRPIEGKIHDHIVSVGDDATQALAHDWFQATASQEPCPVCEVIKAALATARKQERQRVYEWAHAFYDHDVPLTLLILVSPDMPLDDPEPIE